MKKKHSTLPVQGCGSVEQLKKDIIFQEQLLGHTLNFRTTWGLFSPRAIDEGTHLLLEYLDVEDSETVLDIGCGYGPLGVAMGKEIPQGEIHMVDKDYLAVEYANRNALSNNLPNCRAYLSNGLSGVADDLYFDTVVSNIPAKVGRELLTILLCDSYQRMKPGSQIVVVTINGLREFIKRNFKDVFGNYKKLKQGKAYTVARAVKEGSSSPHRGE